MQQHTHILSFRITFSLTSKASYATLSIKYAAHNSTSLGPVPLSSGSWMSSETQSRSKCSPLIWQNKLEPPACSQPNWSVQVWDCCHVSCSWHLSCCSWAPPLSVQTWDGTWLAYGSIRKHACFLSRTPKRWLAVVASHILWPVALTMPARLKPHPLVLLAYSISLYSDTHQVLNVGGTRLLLRKTWL